MLNYKQNITNLPQYNDGIIRIFQICQNSDPYPIEYLKDTEEEIWFEELSISDKLKFEAEERKKDITLKIRIEQNKNLNSLNVVKIGNEYHKIFNTYNFTNKDGFRQTDLTLESYPFVKLEEEL